MKLSDVITFIKQTNGKLFSVKFVKRTTGEERLMVCRTGVHSHLVAFPTKEGTDFKKHELISVFDMQKQGYRSIPIEGIKAIKIDGEWEGVEVDLAIIPG